MTEKSYKLRQIRNYFTGCSYQCDSFLQFVEPPRDLRRQNCDKTRWKAYIWNKTNRVKIFNFDVKLCI